MTTVKLVHFGSAGYGEPSVLTLVTLCFMFVYAATSH